MTVYALDVDWGQAYSDAMSTLTTRPRTAVLVIDVQNGVVEEAHDRDQVVANIAALVSKPRGSGVPVVWVQHHSDSLARGTVPWEYVPELTMEDSEPVVHKRFGDSFEDTSLEEVLTAAGLGHLVVAGAKSDACIRSTIHGAFTRG